MFKKVHEMLLSPTNSTWAIYSEIWFAFCDSNEAAAVTTTETVTEYHVDGICNAGVD